MTGQQERLEQYRARVLEELDSLSSLLESVEDDARPVERDQQSVGRLARMDALQHQAMASETLRRRQQRRIQLQQALRRLDDGEFGYCADCGCAIPTDRLDIDPTFSRCVSCAGRA